MSTLGSRSALRVPERIIYGTNTLNELAELAAGYGRRVALVFGSNALVKHGVYERVTKLFTDEGLESRDISGIGHDPDEDQIGDAARAVKEFDTEVIVGIGGGSVIDAAKAASVLATSGGDVRDYWEGRYEFTEPSIPCIAVPTTSGTGSEITKNAVISDRDGAFKKSIRTELMIPNVALVDPALTLSAPPEVTTSTGLDALIQNLESYTSKNAGPITDTLARRGIELAGRYLLRAVRNTDDIEAREGMSLASLYGGICLANAGLGLAHGLAHPLGIRYGIPHGKACALTMAKVIEYNHPARREKYEDVGMLLGGVPDCVEVFGTLLRDLSISTRLKEYGVRKSDIPDIVRYSKGGSRGYNPVDHDDETVARLLRELV
jgi:alcohol dehydrogenase class IV